MVGGTGAQDGAQKWLDALNEEAEEDVGRLKMGVLEASGVADAPGQHRGAGGLPPRGRLHGP
eukprot:1713190-Pyramimonas_sp.AAC.1